MQAQIAVASSALKRLQRMGAKAADVPTPERLLKAKGLAYVERSISIVGVADAEGEVRPIAIKGVRVRVAATPLEEMAKRRRLDPDSAKAAALLTAGHRYLALWRRAGLSPLQGQDPGKIRSTTPSAGMLGTDRQCEAFSEYRAASDAMDAMERTAVDAIVLHELALLDVGRKVARFTADRTSAIAIAAHELRAGLHRLAIHFGLIDDEAPPVPVAPAVEELPLAMRELLGAIQAREDAAA